MKLGKVLINLLVMRMFAEEKTPPMKEDLFLYDTVTQDSLEKYFNQIISRFRREGGAKISYDIIREVVCDTMDEMCDLSSEYNPKVGNSVSYRDFIRLEAEDKEAYELFHPVVQPGPFDEIEAQFKTEGNKLLDYFKNRSDSELHPFVVSETGINAKQFTQFIGFIGLKPDADGTVIPVTISDNFIKGLSSLESYFINSKGTRKAFQR